MITSEQTNEIATALAAAQAELQGAPKDSVNDYYNSRYADLESCWTACRATLPKHGIAVVQAPKANPAGAEIITRLAHASGQWFEDEGTFVPCGNPTAHGFGQAMTYARRYGLCAMTGIVPIEGDDDGNSAMPSHQPTPQELAAEYGMQMGSEIAPPEPENQTLDADRQFLTFLEIADTDEKLDKLHAWYVRNIDTFGAPWVILGKWWESVIDRTLSEDKPRLQKLASMLEADHLRLREAQYVVYVDRLGKRMRV